MSFNVGDDVSPVVDLISQGYTFGTAGQQGKVVYREVIYDREGDTANAIYDYKVEMAENVIGFSSSISASDATAPSGNTFWFTESDLGVERETEPVINQSQISSDVGNAITFADQTATNTRSLLDPIPTSDPFYDHINTAANVADNHKATLEGSDIGALEGDSLTRQASASDRNQSLLSADLLLVDEYANNLAQLQAVYQEYEEESRNVSEQNIQQSAAGDKASSEDHQAFFDTFINVGAGKSLTTPASDEEVDSFAMPDTTEANEEIYEGLSVVSESLAPEEDALVIFQGNVPETES
jgi:hypothetical protein